jgi:hypothetical protein
VCPATTIKLLAITTRCHGKRSTTSTREKISSNVDQQTRPLPRDYDARSAGVVVFGVWRSLAWWNIPSPTVEGPCAAHARESLHVSSDEKG